MRIVIIIKKIKLLAIPSCRVGCRWLYSSNKTRPILIGSAKETVNCNARLFSTLKKKKFVIKTNFQDLKYTRAENCTLKTGSGGRNMFCISRKQKLKLNFTAKLLRNRFSYHIYRIYSCFAVLNKTLCLQSFYNFLCVEGYSWNAEFRWKWYTTICFMVIRWLSPKIILFFWNTSSSEARHISYLPHGCFASV